MYMGKITGYLKKTNSTVTHNCLRDSIWTKNLSCFDWTGLTGFNLMEKNAEQNDIREI